MNEDLLALLLNSIGTAAAAGGVAIQGIDLAGVPHGMALKIVGIVLTIVGSGCLKLAPGLKSALHPPKDGDHP